jgi:hypothetical protein
LVSLSFLNTGRHLTESLGKFLLCSTDFQFAPLDLMDASLSFLFRRAMWWIAL